MPKVIPITKNAEPATIIEEAQQRLITKRQKLIEEAQQRLITKRQKVEAEFSQWLETGRIAD